MTQKNNFDDAWEEIKKHIVERYTVHQNRKLFLDIFLAYNLNSKNVVKLQIDEKLY